MYTVQTRVRNHGRSAVRNHTQESAICANACRELGDCVRNCTGVSETGSRPCQQLATGVSGTEKHVSGIVYTCEALHPTSHARTRTCTRTPQPKATHLNLSQPISTYLNLDHPRMPKSSPRDPPDLPKCPQHRPRDTKVHEIVRKPMEKQ